MGHFFQHWLLTEAYMQKQPMAETLTTLAYEAGSSIMTADEADDFGVYAKGDGSPVTDVDLA
jgi:3'-phosphoadenosine 5'-phosphosulfate (PAPS) 3'-phosphatase